MAGAVRAMAMARKTAIVSNNDDNHVDGNNSDINDAHDNSSVKDGDNDDDSENDNEDKDNENGNSDGDKDKDNNSNEQ